MNKESIIIGIAGGSGSGKSTFTNRIKERFGDKVVVIYHDNYYRRQDGIPFIRIHWKQIFWWSI